MFEQLKIGVATLALGIVMTFGLIATAAQNLPTNAEAVVTTVQEDPDDGPGGRNGRRDDRPRRNDRGIELVEEFLDFD
ncbi:MAG: hypothetical protein AAF902_20600 [Chloroflexota bacterium]